MDVPRPMLRRGLSRAQRSGASRAAAPRAAIASPWPALVSAFAIALGACGSRDIALDDPSDPAIGDARTGDADTGPDAIRTDAGGCLAGQPQCANGCDDDLDGTTDGADPECTSGRDDDEGSFATGIPGDNMDPVKQDCFFDGNSGQGDDGCQRHICCLLDDPDCATIYHSPPFDPATCTAAPQACIDACAPATPPGCDCFGCCTECDAAGCVDIYVNPAVAPGCDDTAIHDGTRCPTCTKTTSCATPCGGDTCILCAGQAPGALPSSCAGATCPGGGATCTDSTACPSGDYCANGCCISVIH
ncbi:MAG: hypothetical protein K8W52_17915 [Deltaproteobacteria bacterium]|nr:hypothetical protein [Deltaproteobacteria bacterium]